MHEPLNPPDRPRRALLAAVGVLALLAAVIALVVAGGSKRAEASGLEPFGSCQELADWGVRSYEAASRAGGGTVAFDQTGAPVTSVAPAPTAEEGAGTTSDSLLGGDKGAESATGDTNVIVAGVDELDLVDRLDGRRVLIVADGALAVVDLDGAKVLDRRQVGYDAQITYDPDRRLVWVVGSGDQGDVVVRRLAVDGDALREDGSWKTVGTLVAARRVGDRLYVVATDGFGVVPTAGGVSVPDVATSEVPGVATSDEVSSDEVSSDEGGGSDVASDDLSTDDGGEPLTTAPPFVGGPVPCDQVLHPAGVSDPNATLLVAFDASGDLTPVASTEVVGSGQLVHVTTDAAYLATPQWADTVTTTIHRFDLATLDHTGSGRVPGTLLNDFAMSEHGGHLRVAVTTGTPGVVVGRPMPVDDVGTGGGDVVVSEASGSSRGSAGAGSVGTGSSNASETAVPPVGETTIPPTTAPETTVPETTTTPGTAPTTTVPETTIPETTVAPTTEPELTAPPETVEPMPTVPPTEPQAGEPLNQVLVLDIDGELDVVGRTERFGHAGETLQGIRFDGDTAYAVTYLQTDPFYVLDLSTPTAPRVVGQVELPGFSAYLHPVGDGLVVGFGPGDDGRAAAKLFDVSDPTAPKVVDTVSLGDDSPVTYDHHAFVDLGGGRFAVPVNAYGAYVPAPCPPNAECLAPPTSPTASVVELSTAGRRLRETGRVDVAVAEPASRAIRQGGAWSLLAGSQLLVLDDGGSLRATLTL
jgi:uncharacterized secreted protein with C-terminal beta-propeller domain